MAADAAATDLLDFDRLIDWRAEADAVCADLRPHVRHIGASKTTAAGDDENGRTHIHLNVTTLEGRQLCVRMDGSGFRIVGEAHDTTVVDEAECEAAGRQTYETPYALLGAVSGLYTKSFGDTLCGALQQLAEARTEATEK